MILERLTIVLTTEKSRGVTIGLLFSRAETIELLSKRLFSVWRQQNYCHKICFYKLGGKGMAKYAYRAKERKDIICANRAIEEDRNKEFYCPNPVCNAKLYICAIDGSKNAYFRATKSDFKHIENCPYGSAVAEFDNSKFDESKFDYEDAINNILCNTKQSSQKSLCSAHGTGEPGAHPLRTLRQIYSLCKSFPVGNTYGGKEIGSMILDDRSEYRYLKGCFGNKIIEATVDGKLYDDKKKEVYLASPINSKKYAFVLSFSDEDNYKKIRSEIYNNRDKIIVIAGKWGSSGEYNKFTSKVYGKKQVAIIKK